MALGEYFIRRVVQQLVCPAGEVESSHDPTRHVESVSRQEPHLSPPPLLYTRLRRYLHQGVPSTSQHLLCIQTAAFLFVCFGGAPSHVLLATPQGSGWGYGECTLLRRTAIAQGAGEKQWPAQASGNKRKSTRVSACVRANRSTTLSC